MTHLSERELKELLTMDEPIKAPADLAERIKAEIPEDLTLATEATPTAGPRRLAGGRWLALAASVAVMVGGSLLAYRMLRQPELYRVDESTAVAEQRSEKADGPPAADGRRAERRAVDRVAEREEVAESPPESTARGQLAVEDSVAPKAKDGAVRASGGERAEPVAALPETESQRTRDVRSDRQEGLRSTAALVPAPAPAEEKGITSRGASPRVEPAVAGGADREVGRDEAASRETRRQLRTARRKAEDPVPDTGVEHYNAQIAESDPRLEALEAEARALEAELAEITAPKRKAVPPPTAAESQILVTSEAPAVAPAAAYAPPSTGGTAEPNDAPYGDVFFRGYGANPFIDTEDDALSTFGLDVDTGSYAVVRRFLRDGHLPNPDAVRVEELINYFDYGDPPPEEGDFAIHAEGAPSIFGEGERYHLVRFNLHGREIDDRDRRPALLTFVVDVSGSMARGNRLGLVKEALELLLDQLRRDDRVALVVYGTRGRVVLEPTGDKGEIRRAIGRLMPEGSTNAEEGLRLAYDLAARHRLRGAINRVILCSDGVANVGRTSAESILAEIRRQANQGIELTTVGFGMGNYNDVLMERLADTGNGRYAYVDSLDEARRIFVEGLTGTLQTIAAEARVQVEWNPETVARYRLLGYENRDIADERFRDDTVDAGEIGAGHTVTALYEIKLHKKLKRGDEVATLHLRWGSIMAGRVVEIARPVTGADFAGSWEKASPALQLTSLVAEFAEILKGTYWAREGDLDDVFRRAQKVSAEFAGDTEVADFVSLVGRAADHRREERR